MEKRWWPPFCNSLFCAWTLCFLPAPALPVRGRVEKKVKTSSSEDEIPTSISLLHPESVCTDFAKNKPKHSSLQQHEAEKGWPQCLVTQVQPELATPRLACGKGRHLLGRVCFVHREFISTRERWMAWEIISLSTLCLFSERIHCFSVDAH